VQHIAQTAITGIYALHADTDGVLWLGTDTGLLRRATDGVVQPIQLPARALVNHILRDGDTLWLGTSAGLMWQNVHTGESRHYRHNSADTASLSHDVVLTLRRDRAGRLWVGTNSGLNRFDAVTGRFTHYADINTLPSSVIYSIVEDDDSRLWLSTNRGLARFDPGAPAGTRIRSYDASSGTGNIEFNRNAGIIGHDGALYFGGDRGVTFFHPASLRNNPNVPPVVITALERSTREGTRRTRYVADAAVTLAPDDYTVSFEFAALNFTSPHRNRYAYRLDGFDPQWIDAGNGRSASYTNLPPGKYVFRVRAANDDGVWNEAGAAVPVLVRPWFWETWWFRTFGSAALLLLASATTGLFLYNRNRRLVQSIRYQSTLERERSRISRDMHDEVGASLTEIAILSELALQRNGQSRSSRAPLEKIAGRSRAMLDSIGQIIWALNPDNDRLQHLSAYLRAYAADFLDSAGIEARLHFETAADAEPVTAEFRRNIFLVMKEALVNVAKHAHASHALVELRIHGRNLSLRIVDDGRGLVPDGGETSGHQLRFTARGHNGLGNARRRAEELGGILTVISAPDAGTSVHLDVPLPEASVHRAVSS
jgi:signal transduction histidine kinase